MAGNIRQLNAPDLTLRPSETGVEATAGAARRIGGFYNQVADAQNTIASLKMDTGNRIAGAMKDVGQVAVDYMDHKEINEGAAAGATMVSNLTSQWNAKLRDPNFDPNTTAATAAQFREDVLEPALDHFKSGFNTEKSQEWADHFANQFREHMVEKAQADISTMAGIALKANADKAVNGLSSAVASDPSSLDFALKQVDHSIGGMVDSSPMLDPATAASAKSEVTLKAKEAIVKAAVSGMIQKNPNIDLDAVQKKYGDYINGAEIKMFQKAAQTQEKANTLTDKQTALAAKQQADLKVHTDANRIMSNNISIDPQTNRPIISPKFFNDALDIARKNTDAPSAALTARTLLDWGEHQQSLKANVQTDPDTAAQLDARMFTDVNPASKLDILRAEADKKISRSDAEIRLKIIDQRDKMPSDPMFKLAMDGAKQQIEGRSAGEKSLQAGKYASFMQDFLQDYQQQKAAGTLPANALSLRDPKSLINQKMDSYRSPLASAIGGNGGIATSPASARNDAMPAIPPPDQRPAGSIYETPRGKMKWTGTGWVQP